MCIRDSDKGIREEAIDAENILGRWRAVEEPDYDWDDSDDDGACDVPMYLGTVSYTHLDVYKRQDFMYVGTVRY